MELRFLGSSNIKVSPIAFGAWAIGGWMWGGAEDQAAIRAIRTSFDLGITTIDTAPVYGFGRSETLVGKAMAGISRDKYQILTKFGLNWQSKNGTFYFDSKDNNGYPVSIYKWASKEKVMQECEDSLKRLNTDYIDLYQIHWPDASTPISETMEAVQQLIDQGKVRAAGVCNYSAAQVDEALDTIPLVSNQVPYSLINRTIENDIVPQALEKGMGIIPYSPLQRGLLTGKIKPGHQFNEGDSRKGSRYFSEANIRKAINLLDEIQVIGKAHNASLAQLVINWTLHQPGISCTLVGARDEHQVKDNAKSLSFKLSSEELDKITSIANKFGFA